MLAQLHLGAQITLIVADVNARAPTLAAVTTMCGSVATQASAPAIAATTSSNVASAGTTWSSSGSASRSPAYRLAAAHN
jgi:hypothetical protein